MRLVARGDVWHSNTGTLVPLFLLCDVEFPFHGATGWYSSVV